MGPMRPPRIAKLLVGLAIVLLAIWYLSGLA